VLGQRSFSSSDLRRVLLPFLLVPLHVQIRHVAAERSTIPGDRKCAYPLTACNYEYRKIPRAGARRLVGPPGRYLWEEGTCVRYQYMCTYSRCGSFGMQV